MADRTIRIPGPNGPVEVLAHDNGDGTFSLVSYATALDTGALKVSLYGKGVAAGDTALNVITPADGDALAAALRVASLGRAYNGATVDTLRNNTEGTALASAARTAQTDSADIINYNARGIIIFLNVTASAAGTGGLTINLQVKDPVSGGYFTTYAAAAAVTTTGLRAYNIYPGAAGAGNYTNTSQQQIPRTFRVRVTVGDATSYTYSVGYALVV